MFYCNDCNLRWTSCALCPICGKSCTTEPMDKATKNDVVNHPEHYTQFRHKNGLEDLKKARWYLDRAIKEQEENSNG